MALWMRCMSRCHRKVDLGAELTLLRERWTGGRIGTSLSGVDDTTRALISTQALNFEKPSQLTSSVHSINTIRPSIRSMCNSVRLANPVRPWLGPIKLSRSRAIIVVRIIYDRTTTEVRGHFA